MAMGLEEGPLVVRGGAWSPANDGAAVASSSGAGPWGAAVASSGVGPSGGDGGLLPRLRA